MTDIRIHKESVIFHKALYHESELLLAKCYNFEINLETGEITAHLRYTASQALFYFIELAFKNFWESPLQEDRKSHFLKQIDEIYAVYENHVTALMKEKLPYADKFKKHQVDGEVFSYYKKYSFIAYEMRLGKTILSASLSRLLNIRTTVIICPANPKWEWFRQLTEKWGFNELYFSIIDAAKSKNIIAFQERFVIINYDIVGKFHKELCERNVGHFILDEVHKCKNVNSNRTKNVKKLLDSFPDAKVTFLSGTPIKNRVNDIFAYLKLSNHPLGKNHKKFLDEYTVSTTSRGHATRVTGGKNLQDLSKKLANFMLIRTQEECMDVPKKMFITYNYPLDDYREEYNKIIEELSQLKDISSLTGNLHSLNIITSRAKIKGVIEIAEDIIENGQKVVIFCSYKDPLHELQAYFGERCVLVDGSVPSHKRMEYCEKFRDDESKEVFLGNMVAAGEGTDLSCALNVIFVNFPLTPDEIMQPMNRCENMARTKILTVIYTSCDESIDEYLYELIEDKQNEINTFTGKENLNIHRHNTVEHLVSKLLKRELPAEEEEVVTHSMEGGEDVKTVECSTEPTVIDGGVPPKCTFMEQAGNIPPSEEHKLAPVIDIPDFDIFEKVVEKHIEGMKESTSKAMKELTEELIVTGKASMEYIDPIIPPEPVIERLTVEELFKRYPAISEEERNRIKTFSTAKKDDFDLPEFL